MGMQMKPFKNITVETSFNATILAIAFNLAVADNAEVEASIWERDCITVFAETPFYAENGWTSCSYGQILDAAGNVVATSDECPKAPNGQPLHTVESSCSLALNQEYTLAIDTNRRHRVMKNHTAAHLLHAALHNIPI